VKPAGRDRRRGATTLLRAAFSNIIRESYDYTVVPMNTSG
jgi:hypothetical protein